MSIILVLVAGVSLLWLVWMQRDPLHSTAVPQQVMHSSDEPPTRTLSPLDATKQADDVHFEVERASAMARYQTAQAGSHPPTPLPIPTRQEPLGSTAETVLQGTPTAQLAPKRCAANMLESSIEQEGATGFMYTWISYVNITVFPCILDVPPMLRLIDMDGIPIMTMATSEAYHAPEYLPELEFEQGASSTQIILPAHHIAQIILRWPSVCAPIPPQEAAIADLRLDDSGDHITTQIINPNSPFFGEEVCEVSWITITGYKHIRK